MCRWIFAGCHAWVTRSRHGRKFFDIANGIWQTGIYVDGVFHIFRWRCVKTQRKWLEVDGWQDNTASPDSCPSRNTSIALKILLRTTMGVQIDEHTDDCV